MRAQFIRGADPKDAMGIGDPKARLAQSLKELSEKLGYEFAYNKRGTPRMIVPVSYPLDTYGTYSATQHWLNGVVTEIHYTLTYMPDRISAGPISLRKIWRGYNAEKGVAPPKDIKQALLGRFHKFPDVIEPIKTSIKNEIKKDGDITTIKPDPARRGKWC